MGGKFNIKTYILPVHIFKIVVDGANFVFTNKRILANKCENLCYCFIST